MPAFSWSHEEERALLQIRADEEVVAQLEGTCRDSKIYRLISAKMEERGFIRTPQQVKNKLKYLRARWQKVVCHNNTSGRGRKVDPHDDLCHAVWGHRPSTYPINIISSSTVGVGANAEEEEDEEDDVMDTTPDLELVDQQEEIHEDPKVPSDDDGMEHTNPGKTGTSNGKGKKQGEKQLDAEKPGTSAVSCGKGKKQGERQADQSKKTEAEKPGTSAGSTGKVFMVKKKMRTPKRTKLEEAMTSVSSVIADKLSEIRSLADEKEEQIEARERARDEERDRKHQENQMKLAQELNQGQVKVMGMFSNMFQLMMGQSSTQGHSSFPPMPFPQPNQQHHQQTLSSTYAMPSQHNPSTEHQQQNLPPSHMPAWQQMPQQQSHHNPYPDHTTGPSTSGANHLQTIHQSTSNEHDHDSSNKKEKEYTYL